jgi:hypothetical protein
MLAMYWNLVRNMSGPAVRIEHDSNGAKPPRSSKLVTKSVNFLSVVKPQASSLRLPAVAQRWRHLGDSVHDNLMFFFYFGIFNHYSRNEPMKHFFFEI